MVINGYQPIPKPHFKSILSLSSDKVTHRHSRDYDEMNQSGTHSFNRISDVALASFLLCKGHELLDVEDRGSFRKFFVFKQTLEIKADSLRFYNKSKDSAVIARDFWETLRALKASVADSNRSVWRGSRPEED